VPTVEAQKIAHIENTKPAEVYDELKDASLAKS
jgi:hypothetical protein